MRSEKWWSSWSLSLTASTLQPCRAMYWGGIEAGVPSWRLDGARGVCCSAGGAVQAALCVRPADTWGQTTMSVTAAVADRHFTYVDFKQVFYYVVCDTF